MIIDVGYWTRIFKNILMLALSLVLIYLSFKLAIFYMPFLIGFVISLLIEPIIKIICRRTNIERKKVAIFVLVIILGLLLGILAGGIVSLITESTNLMQGFNGYVELVYGKISNYLSNIKEGHTKIPVQIFSFIENSTDTIINYATDFISRFLNKVTQIISSIPVIGIYVGITILATYFICTDKMYIRDAIEHQLPNKWARKLGVHVSDIVKELGNYLKAEAILIGVSFVIVLIGLYALKILGFNVPYPFLSAIRNRICRCITNFRFGNSNDTMGNNKCFKWGSKFRNCDHSDICNNINSKATYRAKGGKQ